VLIAHSFSLKKMCYVKIFLYFVLLLYTNGKSTIFIRHDAPKKVCPRRDTTYSPSSKQALARAMEKKDDRSPPKEGADRSVDPP
jgi:hypothetical protein